MDSHGWDGNDTYRIHLIVDLLFMVNVGKYANHMDFNDIYGYWIMSIWREFAFMIHSCLTKDLELWPKPGKLAEMIGRP